MFEVATPAKTTAFGGLDALALAMDRDVVADDGKGRVDVGVAALGDRRVVEDGVEDDVADVREADLHPGDGRMLEAVDGDVLLRGGEDLSPANIRHLLALGIPHALIPTVKDVVDRFLRGRPGLVEPDGHGGRVLVDDSDGLFEIDFGDTVDLDQPDVLGTARRRERRGSGR